MKRIYISLLIFYLVTFAKAQNNTQIHDFAFEGVVLNGFLNLPENTTPKGIVLIVHGSGRTNAVAQNWHADVRHTLLKAGYGTFMWDKMGCGKSGGTFNYNQTVQNSAMEAIAAINYLKKKEIPGAETIGLWGISRAGWINPIVINTYKNIKFWISVSGVDALENFNYLFEENLKINNVPQDSIQLLLHELKEGVRITHSGGSFETYMEATKNLRNNEFLKRFNNYTIITKEGYYDYQKSFMKEKLDKETGLQVYIPGFENLLSGIKCPVLALFGEKDKNVDWQKTKNLYQQTLGKNHSLTIQSFAACNHNMYQCKTGGFYEFEDDKLPWNRCEGFLEAIENWLNGLE